MRDLASLVMLVTTALTMTGCLATDEDGLPPLLVVGAGMEYNPNNEEAVVGRLLYRGAPLLKYVRPFVGADLSHEGAAYFYAGGGPDILTGLGSLVFTPGFGAGYYHEGGGPDLGYGWEFRTGAELTWQFENGMRLGIAHHHVSNGGNGSRNPGQERIMLVWSIPIGD